MPEIAFPPKPKEFEITKEWAKKETEEARKRLIERAKEDIETAILNAARQGSCSTSYDYDCHCNKKDIDTLVIELEYAGFNITRSGDYTIGIYWIT